MAPECPNCAEAQARVDAALEERDRALLDLARALEELNAVRLREQWKHEDEVPPYPLEAGAALPVPLRYRLADRLNRLAHGAPGVRRLRAWLERKGG